jgi:hypothetical protein
MEFDVRVSRHLAVAAATTAAALVLAAVPVSAATLPPNVVANAYSVMLTAKDARQVGIRGDYVVNFDVANSTKGTPDAPWLCELSGDRDVEGKGAAYVLSSETLSLSGRAVTSLGQEIHWYANAKQAKKAYDGLVKLVKQCEGEHASEADGPADGPFGTTSKLTNGTGKAKDGDPYLWVRSETVVADPTTQFADHDYITVRHFGRFIQIIQLESEGTNAPGLTKKQIAATDRLTDALGDAWKAKFR